MSKVPPAMSTRHGAFAEIVWPDIFMNGMPGFGRDGGAVQTGAPKRQLYQQCVETGLPFGRYWGGSGKGLLAETFCADSLDAVPGRNGSYFDDSKSRPGGRPRTRGSA